MLYTHTHTHTHTIMSIGGVLIESHQFGTHNELLLSNYQNDSIDKYVITWTNVHYILSKM